jgi:dolichol-phosphate mannosyltransferase
MYRELSVAAVVPAFNEERKLGEVLRRIPREVVDEVIVVDDGSTDASGAVARAYGATLISFERTIGVGAALRAGYDYAKQKRYDVAVVMAGNNKDFPEEIPLLLDPIADGRAAFVQGSRFLVPAADFGEMPLYRRFATRLHPWLFSMVSGRRVTESTNGFRAVARRVLDDPRLDLTPAWLDTYELEPYLYLETIRLGYPTCEVPVHKVYPAKQLGQTKMRPLVDWWRILRPLFYAAFRRRPSAASDPQPEES